MTALQPFAARPNLKRRVRAETHAQGDEGTGEEGQNRPQTGARPPRRVAAQHPCQHPQGKARPRKLQDARAGQANAQCHRDRRRRSSHGKERLHRRAAPGRSAQARVRLQPAPDGPAERRVAVVGSGSQRPAPSGRPSRIAGCGRAPARPRATTGRWARPSPAAAYRAPPRPNPVVMVSHRDTRTNGGQTAMVLTAYPETSQNGCETLT
jgi:hypothetical protein